MTVDQSKQSAERAKSGSIIESIGMSLERFNGSLSDDRKIKLFAMNHTALKKLATDIEKTQTGIKAISLIVAAITASEQERRRTTS